VSPIVGKDSDLMMRKLNVNLVMFMTAQNVSKILMIVMFVLLLKFFTTTNVRIPALLELSKLLRTNVKTVQACVKPAAMPILVLNVTLPNY
jgi:hypothetical protein